MRKTLLNHFHSRSLSLRLYALIIPTTILAIGLYGYLNVRVISHIVDTQVEDNTRDIALQLASDLANHSIPGDPAKLHAWLEELTESNSSITRIDIFQRTDKELKRIATTSPANAPPLTVDENVAIQQARPQMVMQYREKERLIKIIAPVFSPIGVTGCVSVTSSLRQSDLFARQQNRIAFYLVPAMVVVLILMLHNMFTRVVTRRIGRLSHAMTEAGTGNLRVRAPEERRDELGIIAARYNETMDEIERASGERDRLLEELQSFNQKLQERVREATSDLSAANERLSRVNRDLIEAQRLATQYERMAVAGQLAATFAHEIGSPLSAVSTHLQLLAEDAECSSDSKRRVSLIQQQLNRITSFVEELLSETRTAAKTAVEIQINDVIRQVLRFLEEHLAMQKVNVELDLRQGLPAVLGDAQQLQQVFLNLLNNAGDAMPGGGTIRIATREVEAGGERWVQASVADTGTGIPEEKQAHIFEPFFSTKDLGRGTGLGLSIAARIIRQFGGSIGFESTRGTGTTFYVRLPAAGPGLAALSGAKSERQSS